MSECTARRPTGLRANQGDEPTTARTKCPQPTPHKLAIIYRCGVQLWASRSVKPFDRTPLPRQIVLVPCPPWRWAAWQTTSDSAHRRVADNGHCLCGKHPARTKCPNRSMVQPTQIPRTSVEPGPRHNRDKMSRISPRLPRCSVGQTRLRQIVLTEDVAPGLGLAGSRLLRQRHLPLQPTGVMRGSRTRCPQAGCFTRRGCRR